MEYTAAGEEGRVIELPDRLVYTVAASDETLYAYDELNGSILELDLPRKSNSLSKLAGVHSAH